MSAALGGFLFVAFGQLHLVPDHSPVPAAGAVLWCCAAVALARSKPRGPARRLVVLTAAVTASLLVASLAASFVDNTLYPDVLASLAFLATLQCFAATLAEIASAVDLPALERAWEITGRLLVVVDAASALFAVAWAANLVERRAAGRFRITAVGLVPLGVSGHVVASIFTLVLAVAGASFAWSAWRTWSWARESEPSTVVTR